MKNKRKMMLPDKQFKQLQTHILILNNKKKSLSIDKTKK